MVGIETRLGILPAFTVLVALLFSTTRALTVFVTSSMSPDPRSLGLSCTLSHASLLLGLEPVRLIADLTVLRSGGWPSHPIYV